MIERKPLLEVTDLVKQFDDGDTSVTVLKGVDLSIERDELVALMGPSGSGKSTLLSILGTLMRPTRGRFEMLGVNLIGAKDVDLTEFRNQHIGFVFQAHNLLLDFTSLENVIFPAAARKGRETVADRRCAAELLDQVGLADRRHFPANKLSGGQKQSVAVARALMNGPELVFADEPTGNLDLESARRVMDFLIEINRVDRTTFLICTHDEKITDRCRRVIRMFHGQFSKPG